MNSISQPIWRLNSSSTRCSTRQTLLTCRQVKTKGSFLHESLQGTYLFHTTFDQRVSYVHKVQSTLNYTMDQYLTRGTGRRTDIVAFYRQHDPKKDSYGRTLTQILNWSNEKLEDQHNYIQIIFPLPEASGVVSDAPIVDQIVWTVFNSNGGQTSLHINLQKAFIRMLAFYGFKLVDETKLSPKAGQQIAGTQAEWADDYEERFTNWIRRKHNHLRITRIIRSLRVLGREDLAKIMLEAVKSVWQSFEFQEYCDPVSIGFWERAYGYPLYILPQDNPQGNVGPGLGWLKEILQQQE